MLVGGWSLVHGDAKNQGARVNAQAQGDEEGLERGASQAGEKKLFVTFGLTLFLVLQNLWEEHSSRRRWQQGIPVNYMLTDHFVIPWLEITQHHKTLRLKPF